MSPIRTQISFLRQQEDLVILSLKGSTYHRKFRLKYERKTTLLEMSSLGLQQRNPSFLPNKVYSQIRMLVFMVKNC